MSFDANRSRRPVRGGGGSGRIASIGWWLGLLALTGCASPLTQPMGLALGPPVLCGDVVVTADGYRLPLRVWRPEGPVVAVLVALHGFNDYSNAFATVGPVFARHGILTYAYDQRGFGATIQPGLWPGTETLIADLQAVTEVLLRQHPGVPLYLLGESMGGAVVMSALADPVPPESPLARVAGAVLVAPAVWGRETMGLLPRLALAVTNALVPNLTLTAPKALHVRPSDNDEMLRAYGRDPLVLKATRVDTINGLVELMGRALASAPRFHSPALVLYGAHDQILPHAAIERMLSSLPRHHQSIAIYRDGWHMLLRDRHGGVVVDDIVAWLRTPAAPLLSGADRQPQFPLSGS